MKKNYFPYTLILLVCTGVALLLFLYLVQNNIQKERTTQIQQAQELTNNVQFNKYHCSFPQGNSIDPVMQVVTNNVHSVDKAYVPPTLVLLGKDISNPSAEDVWVRGELITPISDLIKAARSEGIFLRVNSGYRSFDRQTQVFNNSANLVQEGEYESAARPGYSEHQLGTAIDISASLSDNSASLQRGYVWLKNNAYKYGFTLSYPSGKETITNFRYEPWHHRYIGVSLATKLHNQGELFNETQDVFYLNPFQERNQARHYLLSKYSEALLLSKNMTKILIDKPQGIALLSTKDLKDIVKESQQTTNTSFNFKTGESNQTLTFSIEKNIFWVLDKEYKRIQLRAEYKPQEYLLIDVVDIERFGAQLVLFHAGKIQQSDLFASYVLSNCR